MKDENIDKFVVSTDNGTTYLTHKTAGLTIKVEKNRALTNADCGIIMVSTLYQERLGFEQVCDYFFEAVNPIAAFDAEAFYQAADYFFNVSLNTSYYVKKVPMCSSLYTGAIFEEHAAVVC